MDSHRAISDLFADSFIENPRLLLEIRDWCDELLTKIEIQDLIKECED